MLYNDENVLIYSSIIAVYCDEKKIRVKIIRVV